MSRRRFDNDLKLHLVRLVPKGIPAYVVNKINAAVRTVLQDPAAKQCIENTGALIVADTPEKFAQQLKDEYETYKRVVEQQKLTLENGYNGHGWEIS